MKKTVLLGAAVLFLVAGKANAASFNCSYARLPVEVAICQSNTLHILDERMSSKYYRLKNRLPGYQWRQVRRQQKSWLRDRNRCGYDTQCLIGSYNWRIGALNRWLDNY